MATHRDWIDEMNRLSETVDWDDRMMCEMFIMYLHETQKGVAFYEWFKKQVREETAKRKAVSE